MPALAVRDAARGDLPAIAAIYAAAADATPATFDLEGPPLAWWRSTLAACDPAAGHALLVAVRGEEVLGYAKSGVFKEKAAYATTCETSVYVAEQHRGEGVGDALYRELLARLDASAARLAVAGVTEPNPASERLHLAHGFTEVGTFRGVGVKLGRAWDVRWYQRPLRSALSPPT
jgi:L-amino acid N-acyltransferase YncA